MNRVTATIITLNEADKIRACIESLQRICNEIIVVDSGSADGTIATAESLGAKVYRQAWRGDGPQKDYGVQFATNDWILSLDADERLDEDFVAAVNALDLDRVEVDAFAFRRKNYVGNHRIEAAGFYPDYVIRLYNKHKARYQPKKAHSFVDAKTVSYLDAHIIHHTYESYSHWIESLNFHTSNDAWSLYDRGVKPSRIAPVTHALAAGIRKYIFKGGFMHGLDGLTVTLTTVFRAYMKYMKLNERYERDGPPGGKR